MKSQPAYFEGIRLKAARLWEQLEAERELAGPWYLLFNQVQSPRHVVSELLQNADDAGATEALVNIHDGIFSFSHNGIDFNDKNFASLCSFASSDKRTLHTIGFRGIGFKTTFSIGDEVTLLTPTLSVAFRRKRFTEPIWIAHEVSAPDRTEIRVPIKDGYRQAEIERNLNDWLANPFSLVFFKSLRRLQIRDAVVHWEEIARGPIENSTWMELVGDAPEKQFLRLQSSPQEFPEESLDEMRQERLLPSGENFSLPASEVSIILGAEGRLYVVLPTGVKTALPFACNAPSIQDPARDSLKAPAISPTNRWLLKRVGELAAAGMLAWLRRSNLSEGERSPVYALLPDVNQDDTSLESNCATLVKEAFEEAIRGQRYLLAEGGELHEDKRCVVLPAEIIETWPPDQASALFDAQRRAVLSRQVTAKNRRKLLRWGCVEEISKQTILQIIGSQHLPKPQNWSALLELWAFIAPNVTAYQGSGSSNLHIAPVHGRDTLYAATEVVRLAEERVLNSEEDWKFLAEYLFTLDPAWLGFLSKERLYADKRGDQTWAIALRRPIRFSPSLAWTRRATSAM